MQETCSNIKYSEDSENRFLLYMDIVGSKQLKDSDQGEKALINLINDICNMSSEFKIVSMPQKNGIRYEIIPKISNFSDHIVISI